MKKGFSILILCFVISPIFAGVEEQAIKHIITLFKAIITSDFQAEVTNAEQKLDKSNPKEAINHLLIAGLHLKTGNNIVHWEDARESYYTKQESPKNVLALMITDILESNRESKFLDDSVFELLKKSQEEINTVQ